jgi:hypothetical protein
MKQATKEKNMYIHILKLHLNIVPELRHLLYWRKSFCMPVSMKSAASEHSHVLTPCTNFSLLLKHCDLTVIVTLSEIMAKRSVVKQFPAEILQQCSSMDSCMWMRIVLEENYTRCQHSAPSVLNGLTQSFSASQYTCDVTVVPCCMNSTISTLFLSHRQLPSAFWQTFL